MPLLPKYEIKEVGQTDGAGTHINHKYLTNFFASLLGLSCDAVTIPSYCTMPCVSVRPYAGREDHIPRNDWVTGFGLTGTNIKC